MSTYVIKNAAGDIEMWDAQPFPGSTLVDYEVVRGWDGKPYKAGEEPPRPAEAIFESLRAARDVRLAATDKYLLADYPIRADNLALVKTYRAALRALPEQPGAPWDGGGEATPWPDTPDILQTEQSCA